MCTGRGLDLGSETTNGPDKNSSKGISTKKAQIYKFLGGKCDMIETFKGKTGSYIFMRGLVYLKCRVGLKSK